LATAALFVAATALLGAKPYEDTRHRFRVELPEGWALTPQFGDVHGMVFQRTLGTRQRRSLGTLIIHTDSSSGVDTKQYAEQHERALSTQGGFERVKESAVMIGGLPALAREYRALASKKPEIKKTMRAHFLEVNGVKYLLHFESITRDFTKLEGDITTVLASFTPLAKSSGSSETAEQIAIEPERAAANLAGRWVNDDGLVMVLGGDGSFALDEANGRYEVRDNVLTMIIPDKGRESFTFAYDAGEGTLTLSSPNLGEPMLYRRVGASSAKASPTGDLTGRWITPTASGPLVLDLRRDKSFVMGSSTGQWSVSGDRLTLIRNGADMLRYTFRLNGDRLALSGGDLEVEVVFSR
jgi:hypothetical protein